MKIDWPKRGHNYISADLAGLNELLLSDRGMTSGEVVKSFEKRFQNKFGLSRALATMSCAHALDIIGKLVVRSDIDEVIIPAHTYCASAIAFGRLNCSIVWADIDPSHLTITLEQVIKLCSDNTRAIVVVHLYGGICPEISKIAEFAESRGITLIEDCAQCIGANLGGKMAGSWGDFSAFSFHAQKNLTTLGEGGMLCTKHSHLEDDIVSLRLNGHRPFPDQTNYWLPAMTDVANVCIEHWPMKSTLTEAQALVGLNLLNRLDAMNQRRKALSVKIANELLDFKEISFQDGIDLESHCNHLLPIKINSERFSRNDLISFLFDECGIKCATQYLPLYRYSLFEQKGYASVGLPVTDDFYDNMVSLPFSHEMSDEECDYLVSSIQRFIHSSPC